MEVQYSVEFGVGVLQKIVDAVAEAFKTEYQRRDLLGQATRQYVEGLIDRFGEVKVLGMHKPVPLLSLYVRANILEKVSARASARLEDLEGFFDFDRRTFGVKKETKDGESIANHLNRFIVLGKPGAGKTTFLKYLALAMVHQQSTIKRRRLPIFVALRDWADKKCGLPEYITQEFDTCGFENAGLFVERLLRQGNCLVLFDGLDEVSQEANLDGILRDIRDFTDKYSDNQYIMSCRVAAYNNWFERFSDVEMADFDEAQIQRFVKNWFAAEPNTAEECLKRLNSLPQLRELASVPLLLTLLCISYDDNNDFPTNRAELYKDAVEALLRRWDSSRRIRRDDPYKQLSVMQKENMFAHIAYGAFTENRYFLRVEELTARIGEFIGNLPAFKAENLEVDSAEVLRTLESHHGIFVERAKNIHSFSHLTFQEYFTAKYIVDNSRWALGTLVQEHLHDEKWKEVFLLVAGMLPKADDLVLLMLQKNREMLDDPDLNHLLETATKMLLPGENKYTPEARTAVAISIILTHILKLARELADNLTLAREIARDRDRSLVRDRTFVRSLTYVRGLALDLTRANNSAKDLALALRDLTLAHDFSFSISPNLARDLDLTYGIVNDLTLIRELVNDFTLARDLVRNHFKENNLNQQFYEKLSFFLKASLLLAECLNAAGYVTKATRAEVLEGLLAPREAGE